MNVELDAVTVAHGARVVLGPVSHRVATGSWLGVIGPNGAGKTSLLHAVAGLTDHGGEVTVGTTPLRRLAPRRRARLIALVPQRPAVPDDMCVADYALLGRTAHIAPFGVEGHHDRAVVADALERLDLTDLAGRQLTTLSGGELQRVLLARALVQEAPVLLLDEPTTGLDLGHQQQVLGLVDELRRELGLTVVMSMHDLTLAGTYADTLMLLAAGQPVLTGGPDEVLTEASLRRVYRADVEVLRTRDGTPVVVPLAVRRAVPVGPTGMPPSG